MMGGVPDALNFALPRFLAQVDGCAAACAFMSRVFMEPIDGHSFRMAAGPAFDKQIGLLLAHRTPPPRPSRRL